MTQNKKKSSDMGSFRWYKIPLAVSMAGLSTLIVDHIFRTLNQIMANDVDETVVQYGPFRSVYCGMRTDCPFCDEGYPTRPDLSMGRCHRCGTEFEIQLHWEKPTDE